MLWLVCHGLSAPLHYVRIRLAWPCVSDYLPSPRIGSLSIELGYTLPATTCRVHRPRIESGQVTAKQAFHAHRRSAAERYALLRTARTGLEPRPPKRGGPSAVACSGFCLRFDV